MENIHGTITLQDVIIGSIVACCIVGALFAIVKYYHVQQMRKEIKPIRNRFKKDIEADPDLDAIGNLISCAGTVLLLVGSVSLFSLFILHL